MTQRVAQKQRKRDNRVGYNPHTTPYKQFALNSALGHLLGASVSVADDPLRPAPCFVCDMTAGPGHDSSGNEGSPLIMARHIMNQIARGHRVKLICVDHNPTAIERLRAVLTDRYPDVPVEYFTDQRRAVERVPIRAVGLSYWDTTRYNDLDVQLLQAFGRSHYRMDILITRECLAGYRMQRAAHCPGTLTIQDYLALTGKKRNYLMQYAKHGWWSLGFADNWETRPAKKMGGLVEVNSREGREQWRKWTVAVAQVAETTDAAIMQPQEVSLWEQHAG